MSGGIPPRGRARDARSSLLNLVAEGAVLASGPAAAALAGAHRADGDATAVVPAAAGDRATMLRSGTIERIAAMAGAGEDAASRADQPKIVDLVSTAAGHGDPRYDHFTKRLVAHPSKLGRLVAPHLSSWTRVGRFPSPFKTNPRSLNLGLSFVSNNETILVDIIGHAEHETISREFLRCGPREFIAFHPQTVNAAIVTCGGLAPGLNTVIRELVCTLSRLYGVENIYGVPYGYRGFYSPNHNMRRLTEDSVSSIHHQGGTILGSSRGGFDLKLICDAVEDRGLNQIFIIGGDAPTGGRWRSTRSCAGARARLPASASPKRWTMISPSSTAPLGLTRPSRRRSGPSTAPKWRPSLPSMAWGWSKSWAGRLGRLQCLRAWPRATSMCALSPKSPLSSPATMACSAAWRTCLRPRATASLLWPRARAWT
eukprot:TRINITY_DN431_c0_g1_i1.p1 TRINITY_DN431_c0_g1~~TRINITY_DN431_c0_g1_i1.p1  ORF type:complete len:469 (+),score=76.04 TRINITY_DN431_c0_g1_i1:127-1407(+)